MKTDYIIVAGSSGGHILPAISLVNNLSQTDKKIVFITNKNGLTYIKLIKNNNCFVKIIEQSNRLKILITQLVICSNYFIKNKNIRVIGFGGFLTIVPLFLGRIFNFFFKKNIIYLHEQNIIYGLANKINYIVSNYAFISFPKKQLKKKEIYVGNFFKTIIPSNNDQKMRKIKVLLIGGSAGSVELNNKLIDYIKDIPLEERDSFEFNVQIPPSYSSIKEQYEKVTKNIFFFSFINDLQFDNYDLIFSRCGSGSMFEILYFTNRVYFHPHLHSRDSHQKFNKKFFIDNLKLKDEIPNYKKLLVPSNFYFNQLINPFSIQKISSFIKK
ncbi:UDP-N-acetylglucosamine--N-acetylmuramyl-(pentapeptide) pyrophosphoryl-undecaprenol N-acetylglucosamine transferase [Alphaproteobacteria bacterium]|nr:UDP-N-acetylglucosamine--N-acetylmuramyl-(pentapeptide) pyrophosphoryl-undecaprenol N-acetylglucosamine transferase [Alphaproteobacteria bacterium]